MYQSKESGLTVYETYAELEKAPIQYKSEYDGYYYIRVATKDRYDNTLYKVNKQTGEVSLTYFTAYLTSEVARKARVLIDGGRK